MKENFSQNTKDYKHVQLQLTYDSRYWTLRSNECPPRLCTFLCSHNNWSDKKWHAEWQYFDNVNIAMSNIVMSNIVQS